MLVFTMIAAISMASVFNSSELFYAGNINLYDKPYIHSWPDNTTLTRSIAEIKHGTTIRKYISKRMPRDYSGLPDNQPPHFRTFLTWNYVQVLDAEHKGKLGWTQTVHYPLDEYYVVFCARGGVPGHAFIIFGRSADGISGCFVESVRGFYPQDEKQIETAFGFSVPGHLVDQYAKDKRYGIDTFSAKHRMVCKVTKKQYNSAIAVGVKYRDENKDYNLITSNCVNYIANVATSIGLEPPEISRPVVYPPVYIARLIAANKK